MQFETPTHTRFAAFALLTNGIADVLGAVALFFPLFGLRLPGYASYPHPLAFVAGGWGIAALTFGIGRIWTSFRPEFHRVMVVLGLFEGVVLTAYCVFNVRFLGITWTQAMLILSVSGVWAVLYSVALFLLRRSGASN